MSGGNISVASLQHQSCVQWLEVAGDTTVDQMTHKLTFVDIASISKILNEKGLRSNIIKLKFTDKQIMPSEMEVATPMPKHYLQNRWMDGSIPQYYISDCT